jgi:hypothetical protein
MNIAAAINGVNKIAEAEMKKPATALAVAGSSYMVDAGGFEPPTARFVAEYSIQLSYASV